MTNVAKLIADTMRAVANQYHRDVFTHAEYTTINAALWQTAEHKHVADTVMALLAERRPNP
jgi:hypothetical protein